MQEPRTRFVDWGQRFDRIFESHKQEKARSGQIARCTSLISETVTNIRTIRNLGRERVVLDSFDEQIQTLSQRWRFASVGGMGFAMS